MSHTRNTKERVAIDNKLLIKSTVTCTSAAASCPVALYPGGSADGDEEEAALLIINILVSQLQMSSENNNNSNLYKTGGCSSLLCIAMSSSRLAAN